MNYLFEVIKRRISNLFYNSKNISSEIKFIENVFKKSNDKHILVSYIVRPFIYGLNNTHTNLLECYTACQIFDELGYNVDVIDYDNFDCDLTFTKYDLIYGFGEPVERSLYNRGTQKTK
ncbi:hypothetical protein [Hymenobacter sp. PAMC 26628]|uniref:hypothetical protein n=1 Tax=Hymenobacter sp. PAMC 26628 TaxID=1484118 RepID=UPI000B0C2994|nr:hypothetical protein [Hymenobacter sp. PAMC 26628]